MPHSPLDEKVHVFGKTSLRSFRVSVSDARASIVFAAKRTRGIAHARAHAHEGACRRAMRNWVASGRHWLSLKFAGKRYRESWRSWKGQGGLGRRKNAGVSGETRGGAFSRGILGRKLRCSLESSWLSSRFHDGRLRGNRSVLARGPRHSLESLSRLVLFGVTKRTSVSPRSSPWKSESAAQANLRKGDPLPHLYTTSGNTIGGRNYWKRSWITGVSFTLKIQEARFSSNAQTQIREISSADADIDNRINEMGINRIGIQLN